MTNGYTKSGYRPTHSRPHTITFYSEGILSPETSKTTIVSTWIMIMIIIIIIIIEAGATPTIKCM